MNSLPALFATVFAACLLPFAAQGAETTESFFIELPADGIAVTHDGDMALGAGPPGIGLLKEPRIADGLALLVKLRNAGNEIVGFASELEVFPAGADPVMSDNVIWDTDWTLVIPGRGTLYLRQQEISGELGSKVVLPSKASGNPWQGEWIVQTTAGPLPGKFGVIVGGAGEFDGVTGKFVEIATLTGYDPAGMLIGRIELRLHMQPPRK